MNSQKPNLFVPALIGGVVAGVLSSIPFVNCFCCLWIIGGSLLAAYLLIKDSPVVLSSGDGAIVGIFTGIVAAIVYSLIEIPLRPFIREFFQNMMKWAAEYAEEVPSGWEDWLEGGFSAFRFFMRLIASAVFFSILGALGGVLGISLFGKKASKRIKGASDASQNSGDRQP